MKSKFFKRVLCLCVMTLFVFSCMSCFADNSTLEGTIKTTTVYIDGEYIEVPLIENTIQSRSSNGTYTNVQTVFVPVPTQEAKENNEQIVNQIKSGGPMPRSGGSFYDDDRYIYFQSELNYNIHYYTAPTPTSTRFTMLDLISFKLNREIYTQAPFGGFRNATAEAKQRGSIGDPGYGVMGELLDQGKDYGTIEYSKLYSVPTSWIPVCDVGYIIGVRYNVDIVYADGTVRQISYTHTAA